MLKRLPRIMAGISLLAIVFLTASPAWAAPFCVRILGGQPECIYYDAARCKQRANQLSALCTVNQDEVYRVSGGSQYCLVDSMHTALCLYPDRRSCESDAGKSGGICIDSSPISDIQENPFRYHPQRYY